ncbi:sigma-70 family RNA polymerase sigma factor [Ornithinimicrobium sediminis]|uniref:sigma-70 family RNA polymerase sigma factor n=1 Tax=Ornithinimicrobium sediminis TaxID=2904603 RepID=UPI001E584937|nr:sigma-70 family RNA polymerase sigma factor [Ornithinimicrobium sediminis]
MTATHTHGPTMVQHAVMTEACAEFIAQHLSLADSLAGRFRDRGESMDDLRQVARVGLVLAAQRYDPTSPVPFVGFAVPTVLGELRRHFRDHVWVVRPPRRLQELRPRVVEAQDVLAQRLGRLPTAAEVAEEVGEPLADVREALSLATAYSPQRLDDSRTGLAETLVAHDVRVEEVDNRLSLRPAIATLPPRSKAVLRLHYFEGHTQQQIADRIGVSQMQVSRILRQSLAQMRPSVAARN